MDWKEKLADIRTELKSFNAASPDLSKAFGALGKAAKTHPALDTKTIELIATGIAIADRCEPCIMFHTEALIKLGTTREEYIAMLGISIQMGGGPSLMYAGKALEIYDQFSES